MSNMRLLLCASFALSAAAFSATVRPPSAPPHLVVVDKTTNNKETIRSIQREKERELQSNHDAQAWNRLFVEVPERPDPVPLLRVDEQVVPSDFPAGSLLRLGPNGADASDGFMDGDGLIHSLTFPPRSTDEESHCYSSTYVETRGRTLEKESQGQKRFRGTLGSVPRGWPLLQSVMANAWTFQTLHGAQKDTCNTALAVSGDRILSLMEQCPPSEIQVRRDGRVKTIANHCRLDGAIPSTPLTGGALSAHGRTYADKDDEEERVHVSYKSDQAPYVRVDVFAKNWQLKKSIPVTVPCPTMMHDCALSENYVVLFDFPLTLRTSRFLQDKFPVEYEPEYGSRIGLLRRDAEIDNTVWFECEPGVVLHAVNAFEKDGEDGNVVVVQVLRSEPSASKGYLESYSASFLYEYELDLGTQTVVKEGCLNPNEVLEFPIINGQYTGRPTEYVYCNHVRSIGGKLETHRQPETGITLDGITKLSLKHDDDSKGQVVGRFSLPDRWFAVSEPTVVPKTGDNGGGEYVLLIATYVPDGTWQDIPDSSLKSQVLMLDGDELDKGPVWRCDLPYHVNYGLHSSFVPWELMTGE